MRASETLVGGQDSPGVRSVCVRVCVYLCVGAEESTAAHVEVDTAVSRRWLFLVAAWWAGTHSEISAFFLLI